MCAGCGKVGVMELAAERNGRGRKFEGSKVRRKGEKCSNSRMGQKVGGGGGGGAKKDVAGNLQKSELRGCIN